MLYPFAFASSFTLEKLLTQVIVVPDDHEDEGIGGERVGGQVGLERVGEFAITAKGGELSKDLLTLQGSDHSMS